MHERLMGMKDGKENMGREQRMEIEQSHETGAWLGSALKPAKFADFLSLRFQKKWKKRGRFRRFVCFLLSCVGPGKCVRVCMRAHSHTSTRTHAGSWEKSVGGGERWGRIGASRGLNPCDDQVHSNFPGRLYHIPGSGRAAGGCHGNGRPEILTLTSNRPVKEPN